MINDYKLLEAKAPKNEEGVRPNPIRIDGYPQTDTESVGKRLNEINLTAETGGEYKKIGTLLDFNILVKTDRNFDNKYNHFYVEGACKYAYNNGNLASDPVKAATNFIKALDRMPELIDSYRKDIDSLKKDIPSMEKILNTPWRKEKELNELKAKLNTLERRIKESMNNNTQTTGNTQEPKQDPNIITIKPVMPETKPKPGIRI